MSSWIFWKYSHIPLVVWGNSHNFKSHLAFVNQKCIEHTPMHQKLSRNNWNHRYTIWVREWIKSSWLWARIIYIQHIWRPMFMWWLYPSWIVNKNIDINKQAAETLADNGMRRRFCCVTLDIKALKYCYFPLCCDFGMESRISCSHTLCLHPSLSMLVVIIIYFFSFS